MMSVPVWVRFFFGWVMTGDGWGLGLRAKRAIPFFPIAEGMEYIIFGMKKIFTGCVMRIRF